MGGSLSIADRLPPMRRTPPTRADLINADTSALNAHYPLRIEEIVACDEYRREIPLADRSRILSDGIAVPLPRSRVEISALLRASVASAIEDRADRRADTKRVDALADSLGVARASGVHPLASAMDRAAPYASANRPYGVETLSATHRPIVGSVDSDSDSDSQVALYSRLRGAARAASLDRVAGAHRAIAHADRCDAEDLWRACDPHVGTVSGQPMATLGYGPASDDPDYMGTESESLLDPTHTCGRHRTPVLETPELLAREGWSSDTYAPMGGYGRKISIVARETLTGDKPRKPGKSRKRGKRGAKRK